ncbi:hypothetical protein B0H10DRAFT_697028 [Mycena sp. CBHHK59/15]|nr:hypothetical protein B0H10DRAFT_697028 [Mycena sp. CBHHK59/15]
MPPTRPPIVALATLHLPSGNPSNLCGNTWMATLQFLCQHFISCGNTSFPFANYILVGNPSVHFTPPFLHRRSRPRRRRDAFVCSCTGHDRRRRRCSSCQHTVVPPRSASRRLFPPRVPPPAARVPPCRPVPACSPARRYTPASRRSAPHPLLPDDRWRLAFVSSQRSGFALPQSFVVLALFFSASALNLAASCDRALGRVTVTGALRPFRRSPAPANALRQRACLSEGCVHRPLLSHTHGTPARRPRTQSRRL